MSSESESFMRQIVVIASFVVSVYYSTTHFLFRHMGSHYQTPFTGFWPITLTYFSITFVLQLLFVSHIYLVKPSNPLASQGETRVNKRVDSLVGYHFILSNLLHAGWCYTFTKKYFLISEILLIVNFFNLCGLYFVHKTFTFKTMREWTIIHMPVTSLPLAWTIYAIFWNGATLFHSHYKSLLPRLMANILIWEFFVVPAIVLIFYRDWSFGLASSLLAFGLFWGQLTTKVIGFQWGFALVIACLDLLFSVMAMLGVGFGSAGSSNEQAPLLAQA